MGLSALRDVLDPEPVDLSELAGARVGVDANNLLWTFVKGMARGGPPRGPHGRSISHVLGLVNRQTLYARIGLDPVWVFDGSPPELKARTLEERARKRERARERGDEVGAAKLEDVQVQEVQALLDELGVPWIEAPGETDAQLAAWTREGAVDAAVTQDYDAALYGCPLTFRNVKARGQRTPERVDLPERLSEANIDRSQLVDAAILVGTDYNEGLHGVGPVTALDWVRRHGDLFQALDAEDERIERAAEIRALFLEPTVDADDPPQPSEPSPERVRDHLDRHGLPQSKADRLLNALEARPIRR